MSTPPYAIRVDPVAGILHLKLQEFWDTAVFEAFVRDLGEAFVRLAAYGGRIGIFSDTTSFPIQSPEISAAFRATFITRDTGVRLPSAILVGSMLSKLQAQRIFSGGPARIFTDREAALAWLGEQLTEADVACG